MRITPHRKHSIAWAVFAALIPCCVLFGGPAFGSDDWSSLEGDEFSVLHHPDDLRYASRVLSIYEARAEAIASSMGLRTLAPLRAIVASSNAEFSELTDRGVPDWGVGCALPERGLIVLKSPRIVSYPLQMEAVVEHEMAHVAAGKVLRGIAVPRWFHEGVAQAVAGEWRMEESGSLAARAAVTGLPSLGSLAERFPPGKEEAALAYALSFRAVRFLMDESETRTAGELVRAVAEARDFSAALENLTGTGDAGFQARFERFLSRQLSRSLIMRDGRLLFSAAAVLALVAIAVRLRRRRMRMRQWDSEGGAGPRVPRGREGDSRWR